MSTHPGAEEAPECLCAADAQAKQEGTGDRHWGPRTQTHTGGSSQRRSSLPSLLEMNLANITPGQTPQSDRILAIWGSAALCVASAHTSPGLCVHTCGDAGARA